MTIKDIAKISGYAVSTVSRVINNHPDVSEKARKKILKVLDECNFIPNSNARQLKITDTKSIAVMVKGTSNMFFRSMTEKIQLLISKKGYTDVVRYIDEDDNEIPIAMQVINDLSPKGLFFLGGNVPNFSLGFASIDIPAVLMTNGAKDLGISNLSSVCTDDIAGAQAAVSYLIRIGHKNIAIIGGNTDFSLTSELRRQGCIRAFEKAGMEFDTSLYKSSRYSFQSAYNRMRELLNEGKKITAVFAMSDVMAIGAIRAIRDEGMYVPDDISVIGYDGLDIGRFYNPKLTTISQNQDRLITRGVEILLDCIEHEGSAQHEVVPFDLSIGESTRSPRI